MASISVVIPIFNSEKYLLRCFNSIMANSVFVDEIILVNDGSTDNSQQIIEAYDFGLIKTVVLKQENRGLSIARNVGIQSVTSQYFLLLDSDDYLDKEIVCKLNDILTNENFDLVSFRIQRVDESLRHLEAIKNHSEQVSTGLDMLIDYLLNKENFVAACGYLYNTLFFQSQKFSFSPGRYHEDYGLIPYVLLKARKVLSIKSFGYYYVVTPNSIMRVGSEEKEIKKAEDVIALSLDLIKNISDFSITKMQFSCLLNFVLHTMFKKIKSTNKSARKRLYDQVKIDDFIVLIKKSNIKLVLRLLIIKISPKLYGNLFT